MSPHESEPTTFGIVAGLGMGAGIFYYRSLVNAQLARGLSPRILMVHADVRRVMAHAEGNGRVRPRLLGSAIERKRWLRERLFWRAPLFARAFGYWGYRYFFRLGFLDGVQGLIFHFLQGCWYRVLVDVHLYEARRRARMAR